MSSSSNLKTMVRGAYDSGWVLWWLGVVDAGGWRDDYRNGEPWQRLVRSVDATLLLSDAPRLTLGRYNVVEGATATGSTTLATPASEAGNGWAARGSCSWTRRRRTWTRRTWSTAG